MSFLCLNNITLHKESGKGQGHGVSNEELDLTQSSRFTGKKLGIGQLRCLVSGVETEMSCVSKAMLNVINIYLYHLL